jgi:hypothetical protein
MPGGRGRKALPPKPGERRDLFVVLPPDLSIDLAAFCDAHYDAAQTRVVCDALREFITRRLEAEPQMRLRFHAARETIGRPAAEIVAMPDASLRSKDPGR